MKNRRIIFMGTPKIASVVLKTMLENDIHVGLVVTQPDKKKGTFLYFSLIKLSQTIKRFLILPLI